MRTKAWTTIVSLAVSLAGFSATGNALTLDSPGSCAAIGGTWSLVQTPPRFGHCELTRSYTVAVGDTLDLVSGVSLALSNYATLSNSGRIGISRFGDFSIKQGNLVNNGRVQIDDDGRLVLWNGRIENNSEIYNEGYFGNAYQGRDGLGIFNNRRIDNVNGGRIVTVGIFVNQNEATMINGEGGSIENYGFGGIYTANNDTMSGEFVNENGALLKSPRTFRLTKNGTLRNTANIEVTGSGFSVGPDSTVLNDKPGLFSVQLAGRVNIEGQFLTDYATVQNLAGGEIAIGANGTFYASYSVVENGSGSTITNSGSFRLYCSHLDNRGVIAGLRLSFCPPPKLTPTPLSLP